MRQSDIWTDFSKGLDLVSNPSAIEPGFTPNAKNFRISPRGGLEKILGYEAFATLGAAAHDVGYYETRDRTERYMIAAEETAWQSVNSSGVVANIRTSMTSTDQTTFATYEDEIYGLDPNNIMASWDGTTLTTYATGTSTGPNPGIILGVYNESLYIAKADANGDITLRVEWSDPGDFTSWPTANAVELGGVGNTDSIVGGAVTESGLLVYTKRSTYLIYDPSTGANRLVSPSFGAVNRKAICVANGSAYSLSDAGIAVFDGSSLAIVSRNVDPLFLSEQPTLDEAVMVSVRDGIFASFRRESSSTNNLTLDLSMIFGSIMANDYPMQAAVYATIEDVRGGLFFVDATDATKIRKGLTGGDFNGTDIECYYETGASPLGDESVLKRLHEVRAVGFGAMSISARVDYQLFDRVTDMLDFPTGTAGLWGTMQWGTGTWGGYELLEGRCRLGTRGRRISFVVAEDSGSTASAKPVLGDDTADAMGGCALYLLEPIFTYSERRK